MKEYLFRYRRQGSVIHRSPIKAYWEVSCDPISDGYDEDTPAIDIFDEWVRICRKDYDRGLVPIYWFVNSKVKLEYFPGAFNHLAPKHEPPEDFLSYYTHPVDATTRQPINWLTLPVVNKLWRPGRHNKGGMIQEVTGWKPSVLQPYVYLDALVQPPRCTGWLTQTIKYVGSTYLPPDPGVWVSPIPLKGGN